MTQLIAIGYFDEAGAAVAVDRSRQLAGELAFAADATATVVRHRCGRCDAFTSYVPGAGGDRWGPFLARLIASAVLGPGVTGRSRATPDPEVPGVDVAFVGQVHDMLGPGTSMLLLAVPDAVSVDALQGLSPLGGTVLTSSLRADVADVALRAGSLTVRRQARADVRGITSSG